MYDEERSRRPSVITEDLVQKVDGEVLENRRFTISTLSNEFPQVSGCVLYGTVTEHLNYRDNSKRNKLEGRKLICGLLNEM
ncbi:hypothetical protein AVEN_14243-1 [Araneus ventricosus]|uniref:Uncharacterized protein n=1 Tax=Araneus ventricosus TaxID=182803 RepID=A0A4Y2GMC0_ARAVE|nr:hypothetical protein AVEN_14243-1 [Araneus ventricosus]